MFATITSWMEATKCFVVFLLTLCSVDDLRVVF